MTNRTKRQLRKWAIIALVSLVIAIVTMVLLGKTIRYWDITASMQYIEEQAQYGGWTDAKTADYEALIDKKYELAKNDPYTDWLLKSSHSEDGVIIRDFTIILICAAVPGSILSIYYCLSTSHKIVMNEKRQIGQRDPYQDMRRNPRN